MRRFKTGEETRAKLQYVVKRRAPAEPSVTWGLIFTVHYLETTCK